MKNSLGFFHDCSDISQEKCSPAFVDRLLLYSEGHIAPRVIQCRGTPSSLVRRMAVDIVLIWFSMVRGEDWAVIVHVNFVNA